jgi:hypothetical protein
MMLTHFPRPARCGDVPAPWRRLALGADAHVEGVEFSALTANQQKRVAFSLG